jgi:hypothetical protein
VKLSTVYYMLSTAIHRLFTCYQSPPLTPLWVLAATSRLLVDNETLLRYSSTATADIQTITRVGSTLTAAQFGLNNWVHLSTNVIGCIERTRRVHPIEHVVA